MRLFQCVLPPFCKFSVGSVSGYGTIHTLSERESNESEAWHVARDTEGASHSRMEVSDRMVSHRGGPAAGNRLLKNVDAAELTPVGSMLYFNASGRPFKSDGTSSGTKAVSGSAATAPRNLIAVESVHFFDAEDEIHGLELWMYMR